MKAKDFDKKFDDNKSDIIDDLDLSTLKRTNQAQKRVNVDFPSWVIESLDKEASRVGVTRQSIIKLWLVERLEKKAANKQHQYTGSEIESLNSFIENYCGIWKDSKGNRLSIELIDDTHVSVTFTASGNDKPICRPWANNQPASGMIGSYDPEYGSSLDVELWEQGAGFILNLDFDVTDYCYKVISPSIIRNEKDTFLDRYYGLLGPLAHFEKCPQNQIQVLTSASIRSLRSLGRSLRRAHYANVMCVKIQTQHPYFYEVYGL